MNVQGRWSILSSRRSIARFCDADHRQTLYASHVFGLLCRSWGVGSDRRARR